MKKKKYEDLNEIMYQALEFRGEPVYRKQSSRYGTLVTGGVTQDGHHLHYKVEFLCSKRTLSNSKMLWCRNVDTGEFCAL